MIELDDKQYLIALEKHPVIHFMGGAGGNDNSKCIYLVRDKIYLVDEGEDVSALLNEQHIEAEEWVDTHNFIDY